MSSLKKLFKNLQIRRVFCSPKKKINDKVLKKQKKSLFRKDKEVVNLFNNNVDFLDD